MLFCPTDGNLLMVESGPQGWTRFCCQTCPYIHPMEPSDKITRKVISIYINTCTSMPLSTWYNIDAEVMLKRSVDRTSVVLCVADSQHQHLLHCLAKVQNMNKNSCLVLGGINESRGLRLQECIRNKVVRQFWRRLGIPNLSVMVSMLQY